MAGLQFGFGSGILYGLRTDVANATPIKFGILQDVSIDWNGEIKELFGQLQYPVDVARGKTKIEGKAKFAQISGPEFNNLFFGQTIQFGGQKIQSYSEAQTITDVDTQTVVTNGSTASGATSIVCVSVTGLEVGMYTTGTTGIPANTFITAINTTTNTVSLSAATTAVISTATAIYFAGDQLTTTAASASGATTLTLSSVQGLYIGMTVLGTGVAAATTITAINTTTNVITISAALTAAVAIGALIGVMPLSLTTTTPANTLGSPLLTFASTTGAAVGNIIGVGVPGIPVGTVIASLTGTTITMSNNSTAAIAIGTVIPISPAPTVTPNFSGAGVFDMDLGPLYAATGVPFTYTALAQPVVQGTYTVNPTTGLYTFAPQDASTPVLLNYTYISAATGYKITGTNLQMGTTPRFEAVFAQSYNGNFLTLKLFQCVSSKLTMPTKIDDYVINEVDFQAFANAAGTVFELSTSS